MVVQFLAVEYLFVGLIAIYTTYITSKNINSSQNNFLGLRLLNSISDKEEYIEAKPVEFSLEDGVPLIFPPDADLTFIQTKGGKPVTEAWIQNLKLSTDATGVLTSLNNMRRNRKCDCVVNHELKLMNRFFSLRAAFFQWCVVSVLDFRNFRSGKYKLHVGHKDTPKARDENLDLPRTVFPRGEKRNPIFLKETDFNEKRHIKISEFIFEMVEFDGFWPSYCTFVEVKYGYGESTGAELRKNWMNQLQKQIEAVKKSNQHSCPGNNPMAWVFSNKYALQDKIRI